MLPTITQQNRILSPQHSSFHVSSVRASGGQAIISPTKVLISQNDQLKENYRRPHSSYEGSLVSRNFHQPPPNNNGNDIVLLRDSQNKNPSIILHQPNAKFY
jgi:hypothetical protein